MQPDALLASLDDEQRAVALAIHGPVCVRAGAGTGKTRAITHRIAYGVATGAYDPSKVMALTFTTRAAGELRSRLGALGARGVQVRTFHSAALAQLNHFWPILAGRPAPRVYELKARMLTEAAERVKVRCDRPTLRDLAAAIELRKVTGSSRAQFEARLHAHGAPGTLTVAQALAIESAYEQVKDERHAIDFEDVLLATAGMIEAEPSVALHVRESYRHFVVDEYQDVSPAQQRLLDLWLGKRTELCVVGDASQTIYSFAGANAEYLLGFERRYDDAQVVELVRNYRSTAEIVGLANEVMRGRPGALNLVAAGAVAQPAPTVPRYGPGAAKAKASAAVPAATSVAEFADAATEATQIAAQIAELIRRGMPPSEIAVLVRVNAQSALFEEALDDAGVNVRVRGGVRFFDQPEVRQAVQGIRAAAVAEQHDPLITAVTKVLRQLGWTPEAPSERGAIRSRWESLNVIAGMADAQAATATLRQFADELWARAEVHHEPDLDAVTISTLHAAKGLEWETVFLAGVNEGLLPISYAHGLEAIDEERRLFYVGVTRAKRRLHLSWAAMSPSRAPQQASRFVRDLGTHIPGAVRPASADRRPTAGSATRMPPAAGSRPV
ncbi:MAG TPA: ATP-dependent helicase [Candidatus Lumbricidophila sp.]|nr:ATP-dependent helicase [Candidatus Lumbricidophila sp.]